MRIAIVDDIASDRETLRERLNFLLDRLARHADFFEYESGEAFLAAARQERFTMVFLDIYMDRENGVETARELRAFDAECVLVFTTTSTDHALDGFRVRALQYLVKPYTDEELRAVLEEVTGRMPASEPYIEVNAVGGSIRLRFQEILYAQHFQHQILIRTTDGRELSVRQTFREFSQSLNDDRFFLCSRGVLANLEHVRDFDGRNFIFENGKTVTVTRELSKSARTAFGDFLFQRGRRS